MLPQHDAGTWLRLVTILIALPSVAWADSRRQPATQRAPRLPIIQTNLVPGVWAVGYHCLVVRRPVIAYTAPEAGLVRQQQVQQKTARMAWELMDLRVKG